MLWIRLTNALLGWHWVWCEFAGRELTYRVFRRPADNRPFIRLYGNTVFLDNPGVRQITPITFTEDQMPPVAAPR